MDKNTANKSHHNNDTMLKEKTNQDFNKQKPDPNDPNQKKNHQAGADDERENKEHALKAKSGDTPHNGQKRDESNKDTDKEETDRPPNRERNENGKQSENKFEKHASKKGRL